MGLSVPAGTNLCSFRLPETASSITKRKPGIRHLSSDKKFSHTAAVDLYAGILDKIEKNDDNRFEQRAFVSKLNKLKIFRNRLRSSMCHPDKQAGQD
jgi:phytoene/squalene synthetase